MTASYISRSYGLAICFAIAVSSANARTQDFDEDEMPEFLPGLLAEIESPAHHSIKRFDNDLQFDWKSKEIDARIDIHSPSRVNWTGFLESKQSGDYRIHAHVAGRVRVVLDGKPILDSVSSEPQWIESNSIELKFGRHPIEIEFEGVGSQKRIGLYWSGPQFELEPIAHRYFSHRSQVTIDDSFERGAQLSRVLRCTACHQGHDSREPLPAPSLTHLDGNLRREWLVERLTAKKASADQKMPHFGLSQADAEAIVETLFASSQPSALPRPYKKPKPTKPKKDEVAPRTEPSQSAGRTALITLGCLACHQLGDLGEKNLFDGGNLIGTAEKRPADFFGRWLDSPESVNRDHRMPVFKLDELQRADLILYLQSLHAANFESNSPTKAHPSRDQLARGKSLIAEHRCAACHQVPDDLSTKAPKIAISDTADWEGGCLTASEPNRMRPGFGLSASDRIALKNFWTTVRPNAIARVDGEQLMKEQNCVACHARDGSPGLANTLAKLASLEPEIAPQLAALAPPSLTGVGDKLHDAALETILLGKESPRRPWLTVQMPKFSLSSSQVASIVAAVTSHDRIPVRQTTTPNLPNGKATELAAARLVTAEGFGCQSCHKIGSTEPPRVAINAHGTDLTMLGDRIRSSWFRRWVHNPARIIPRMEMPAIQVAAKGVLNDDLDLQLEALWKTLNTPGFEPPKPNPVRIVRSFKVGKVEHANVLSDVLETPRGKYLRPLIIGLPNRHNVLFDLETGRLSNWWVGDTGRQYTRGKSWYWEAGAPPVVDGLEFLESYSLIDAENRTWKAKTREQFVVQFDTIKHVAGGIEWQGRMELQNEANARFLALTQQVLAVDGSNVEIRTTLTHLQDGDRVLIEAGPKIVTGPMGTIAADLNSYAKAVWNSPSKLELKDANQMQLTLAGAQSAQWSVQLSTTLPVDRVQPLEVPTITASQTELAVVPGFEAVQLPLPRNEMPTAFAWSEAGDWFMASLKGRVFRILDRNADGLAETLEAVSDDLPAPYGLAIHQEGVDVLCKTSLIRLKPNAALASPSPYTQTVVADGWGYTADYHDWAVGLPVAPDGCYYMALPCQQDDRSESAARLRGQALKLIPYTSPDSPRAYRIESIAAGLRFPMGLALSSSGELFASDNQGNYNPFNEINHLQFGKRYGFINKLEAKPDFNPPFESPAVNLPHPWTRSVNGLCFLETPQSLKAKGSESVFGPYEGDLIGCEYNGLSLVRMSLQKVNGQFQGAAYMFSRPPREGEATFEGPVTCAVNPDGMLFIGSIHDSGWGGGQNTGSIVRLAKTGELPPGSMKFGRRLPACKWCLRSLSMLSERSSQQITAFDPIAGSQPQPTEAMIKMSVTRRSRR